MAKKRRSYVAIELARDFSQYLPIGRTIENPAGAKIHIERVDYPGRPSDPGTVGAILGRVSEDWVFWSSTDVDCALIISARFVRRVWCPDEQYWRTVFADAPFEVVFMSGDDA